MVTSTNITEIDLFKILTFLEYQSMLCAPLLDTVLASEEATLSPFLTSGKPNIVKIILV